MEKEEQLFKRRIAELAENSYIRDLTLHTDFLTLAQQTVFQTMLSTLPPVKYMLTGGFPMSERKTLSFLASYEEKEFFVPPFVCLKISPLNARFADELSHRDCLGAVMNLGIERDMIGDILTEDGIVWIFVMEKMSAYLAENLTQIRHTQVKTEITTDFSELPKPKTEAITGTVSSPRLDAVAALCAKISRSKAAALIDGEKISINGAVCDDSSRMLKGGEVLSIRGVGKFRIEEPGNLTKKGRTSMVVYRYL